MSDFLSKRLEEQNRTGNYPVTVPNYSQTPGQYFTVNTEANRLERYRSVTDNILLGAGSVVAGLVDTFGTSLHMIPDGFVDEALKGTQQGDFYTKNKDWARTVADLVSFMIPGTLGMKAIKAGSWLEKATKGVGLTDKYARKIFTSGQEVGAELNALSSRATLYAKETGAVDWSRATGPQFFREQASSLTGTAIRDRLKENIAFEVGVYTTMNNSNVMYPDDWTLTDHLLFQTPLPVAGMVIEGLYLKRQIAKLAEVAGREGRFAQVGDTSKLLGVSRVGERDITITQNLFQLDKIEQARMGAVNLEPAKATELNRNLDVTKQAIEGEVKDDLMSLGMDAPTKYITKRFEMSDREFAAANTHLSQPLNFLGVQSLEKIGTEDRAAQPTLSLISGRKSQITRRLKELRRISDEEKRIPTPEELAEANELVKEQGRIGKLFPVVLEPNGIKTSARERGTIAQDYLTGENFSVVPGNQVQGKRVVYRGEHDQLKGLYIGFDDLSINLPKSINTAKADKGVYFFNGVDVSKYAKKYKWAESPERTAQKAKELEAQPLNLAPLQIDDEQFYRQLGTQTLEQRTATWAALETWQRSFVKSIKEKTIEKPIFIDPERHYLYSTLVDKLNMELEPADFARWVGLPSHLDMNKIRLGDARAKYRDYSIYMDIQDAGAKAKKLRKEMYMSPTDLRYYLNLPQGEPGTQIPLMNLFHELRMQGETDFVEGLAKHENARAAANQATASPENAGIQTLQLPVSSSGDLLNWDFRTQKPVVAVYKDHPKNLDWSYQGVLDIAAQQRLRQLGTMSIAEQKFGAPIAQLVSDTWGAAKGPVLEASDIGGLGAGSLRGRGVYTSADYAAGDAKPIRAANSMDSALRQKFVKFRADLYSGTGFSTAAAKTRADRILTQNFADYVNARRDGWVLHETPEAIENGDVVLHLDLESEYNKRRWRQAYGDELPNEGKVILPGPTITTAGKPNYKPFKLLSGNVDLVTALNKLGNLAAGETDHILYQAGKAPIQRKAYWVPSVNLSAKHVSFIRHDTTGELLHVATGSTPKELREAVERAEYVYGEQGIKIKEFPPDKLADSLSSYDEAFEKLINFSDPLAQTGASKGRLRSFVTGERALEDIQESFDAIFESALRRNRAIFMEPYIKQARVMDHAVEATGRSAAKELNATPAKRYLSYIYGNSTFNAQQGLGKAYSGLTESFDAKLAWLQDKLSPGSIDFRIAKEKEFVEYNAVMGNYNPYSSAVEYANSVIPTKIPWTTQGLTQGLNAITSALTLRLFEFGHPLLNIVSLMATTPAIIKAMRRMEGETRENWLSRTGGYSTAISSEANDAIFSPYRLLTTAAHNYWNKEITLDSGKKILLSTWAHEQGYTAQSVADMVEATVRPHQSQTRQKIGDLVNFLSKPSDKSESFSRGIAFHIGWEVAEGLGIQENKVKAMFAHDMANKIIGDYRPTNRSQMFQGAIGSPLGLFTTFMWNYNERLFKYIENKNARAFYTQIATQAALFGLNSVPGYSQYVNFFANNYDGTSNPVTGMNKLFGPAVTDWFQYGTVSNLPKLFGANDGIAFFQRGDAGLKMVPTLFNPLDAPAVRALTKTYQGLAAVYKGMRDNGFKPKQIAETLAQYSISRPFRSVVELSFDRSLDNQGRIVDDDIQSTMGVISRVLGMKKLSEAKEREANYQIGASRYARNARLDELTDSVRSAIRDEMYQKDPALLTDHAMAYIQNGGTPDGYAQFMRNQNILGRMDPSMVEAAKLLNGTTTNKDMQDLLKLMNANSELSDQDFTE